MPGHHFMARSFSRVDQYTYNFIAIGRSGNISGLVRDKRYSADLGVVANYQHWNGAKIFGCYYNAADSGGPIAGTHRTFRVQFQQPHFTDAPNFGINGGIGTGLPALGMKFTSITLNHAGGPVTYNLADATVVQHGTTADRGEIWEAVWIAGADDFGADGSPANITIKDTGSIFVPPASYAVGINLSGMEWATPGIRFGNSTYPNINWTAPRASTIAYLASQGVTKARLNVQWELLQPLRASSPASAATQAAFNTTSPAQAYVKGAFQETYAQAIDKVLDAALANGVKIIIDLHNYCRYKDFVYDGSGNVVGLVNPADDVTPPYTSDNTKVVTTIFANTATGPTLTQADFTDFWTRAANRWKNHGGLGGYSLMNEPHDMPTATTNTPWNNPFVSGNVQDYSIWNTYAQAAVTAIRAVDAVTPIYVGGNEYQNPMNWASINPGFPLAGSGLIYDFHLYLDATSGGFRFDWDEEVAKGFSAGEGGAVITTATGTNRIAPITAWAAAHGNPKLACTEFGLPVELRASTGQIDQRWLDAGKATIDTFFNNNIEVHSWMGGDHWVIRGYPINHVPRWYQNQTVEPQVGAYMQAKLGTVHAVLFDEGPNYGTGAITIKVQARGFLPTGITVTVAADKGTLSKTTLTLAAGVNSEDTYTYTPVANDQGTISYSRTGGAQVPPNRVVYSYADPATQAGITAAQAALAIVAKYSAGMWLAQDAYTDYMGGAPCVDGNSVRAVSDKVGAGSTIENPLEMVNWFNNEAPTNIRGTEGPTTFAHDSTGFACLDFTTTTKRGLYSKHLAPVNNPTATNPSQDNYPLPAAKAPFNLEDQHFGIVVFKLATAGTSGVLAAAQEITGAQRSVLYLNAAKVELRQSDTAGVTATLADTTVQPNNTVCVAGFTSTSTAQKLRVNSVEVATGAHAWAAGSNFSALTWGNGYWNFFPQDAASHKSHALVFGKGAIRSDEMSVVEAYLKTFAYSPPVLPAWEVLVKAYFDGGNNGWFGDNRALAEFKNGIGVAPTAANGTETVSEWLNHYNPASTHKYSEVNPGSRALLSTDGGGHIYVPGNTGAPVVGSGGSTTSIYICVVMDWFSYYGTILSSMNAANVGIRLLGNSDDAQFKFLVGNGTTTSTAVVANGLAAFATPVGKCTLEAWWDGGATISISLNGGAAGTAAFSGPIAAGAADMTIFSHVGGSDPAGANTYAPLILKNACPNATDRGVIRAGMKALAGL